MNREMCLDGIKLDKYPKLKGRIDKINESLPEDINIFDVLSKTGCSLVGSCLRNVLFGLSALPVMHLVCRNKETFDYATEFLKDKKFKSKKIADDKIELSHEQENTIAITLKMIDKETLNYIESFYISANQIFIDSKLKIYWMSDALIHAASGRYAVCQPTEYKIIKTIEFLNSIGFRMQIASAQKMIVGLADGRDVKIMENIML